MITVDALYARAPFINEVLSQKKDVVRVKKRIIASLRMQRVFLRAVLLMMFIREFGAERNMLTTI